MNNSHRKSLYQTINAISSAVEARDLYTVSHQTGVSNIARVIGQMMTLPEDQIECLRIAGTLHDIGKIGVPSEILSKPARLNDEEYALIKRHSVLGEKILKDVDFPWPVGKIIRQHHERLDGSGYPDGLMGEDILFEAKVIAVADVVHAMMLPRSYRVGLGPEIASGEIRKNRGRLYDPEIVDACLAIFDEKRELLQPEYYERAI